MPPPLGKKDQDHERPIKPEIQMEVQRNVEKAIDRPSRLCYDTNKSSKNICLFDERMVDRDERSLLQTAAERSPMWTNAALPELFASTYKI